MNNQVNSPILDFIRTLDTKKMNQEELIAAIQKRFPDYEPVPVEQWENEFEKQRQATMC